MKTLVLIITDAGFLVPSLALVRQLLANPAYTATADVMLVTIDLPLPLATAATVICSDAAYSHLPLSSADLSLPEAGNSFLGHVPVAAMARLAIIPFIPARYTNIVYLDGDVRLASDISSLLALRLAPGEVAAGAENFILIEDDDGGRPEWLSRYLNGLELAHAADYFNSGVLAFRRDTWAEVGPAALTYFVQHRERCPHHDQSALNAVLKGGWSRLAPAYNFHTYFLQAGVDHPQDQHILHFASSPKPWQSPDSLWDPRLAEPYREVVRAQPDLASTIAIYDVSIKRSQALRRAKQVLKSVLPRPEVRQKRRNFDRYCRNERFILT